LTLSPDEVRDLFLEDAAVLSAWYESYRVGESATPEGWIRVPDLLEVWCLHAVNRDGGTEGRHQQPLLRSLIDALQNRDISSMTQDEARFLCAVHDLACASANGEAFERPRNLIAPHLQTLRGCLEHTPNPPGLQSLSSRVSFRIGAELEEAKPRQVKNLAGIEMGVIGPVTTHEGNLKVLGGVPESCLLVVNRGSCFVSGFVLGKVAVTENCEVFGNISGLAISRQGSIRTRNILNGAFVVAKAGEVACRGVQGARIVFGGTRVSVHGDIQCGKCASPRIKVSGNVRGAELHGSDRIEAFGFHPWSNRPSTVLLRGEITGKEYGEVTPFEAQQLVAQAVSLRFRLGLLSRASDLAEAEADEAAAAALLYLYLGEDAHERLKDLQTKQDRLAYLRRLICALESFKNRVEDKNEAAPGWESVQQDFQDLAKDETSGEEELPRGLNELVTTWKTLHEKERVTGLTADLLGRMRELLADWIRDERALTLKVEEMRRAFGALSDGAQSVLAPAPPRSKVQLLRRFIGALKSKNDNEAVARRLNSTFCHLMLRNISKRLERSKYLRDSAEEVRSKVKELAEALAHEYQLGTLWIDSERNPEPVVTGRFSHGSRIALYPPAPDGSLVEGSFVLTPETGDRSIKYVRRNETILELESQSPAQV
jgi:hypothetical protein